MNQTAFQKSLKPAAIEEFLDYYFFRRAAHALVPGLIKIRISPNQVTTLSLIAGLAGSYLVLQQRFLPGAFLAVIAIILDCCDGQIARLTGQTSPLGRAIDGFFDLVWIAALWLAVYNSDYFQQRGYSGASVLMLMVPSSISMILHCWKFDAVKLRYLSLVEPAYSERALSANESWRLMKKEFSEF